MSEVTFKKYRKYFIILMMIFTIVLATVLFLNYQRNNNDPLAEKKNLINESLYVKYGKYEIQRGDGGLELTKEGSNKPTIVEADPFYINATKEGIYFEDVAEGNRLMKVDYRKQKKEVLIDDEVTHVLANDGKLYYSSFTKDNKIYRVDANGKNMEEVTKDGSISFFIEDGFLYYASDGLYKQDLKTDKVEKVHDGQFWRMYKDGKYLYYIKSNGEVGKLYRLNLETQSEELLVDDILSTYFMYDHYILYSISFDGKDVGLFQLDLNTMKHQKISELNTFNMYEKDSKVYMTRYFDREMIYFDIAKQELVETTKERD